MFILFLKFMNTSYRPVCPMSIRCSHEIQRILTRSACLQKVSFSPGHPFYTSNVYSHQQSLSRTRNYHNNLKLQLVKTAISVRTDADFLRSSVSNLLSTN